MCFPRRLFAPVAAVVAGLLLAPAAHAAPSPVGAVGVRRWNVWVCGKNWVPTDLGHGDYFNIYNAGAGNTCISAERYHLSWGIARIIPARGWQYPNVSSGWEWGRYTCNDGRSAYPSSRGSKCMRYPVQERSDGTPLTSVLVQNHPGAYNAAYDIWFNKTDGHPNQDNGAEIMVWLEHPNIYVPPQAIDWYVTIQGVRYEVASWVAFHNGVHWNYLAYIAVRQRTSLRPTWLNAFFRDAIRHGRLVPSWWLTSIDFGFEITRGGLGLRVYAYSLTRVR